MRQAVGCHRRVSIPEGFLYLLSFSERKEEEALSIKVSRCLARPAGSQAAMLISVPEIVGGWIGNPNELWNFGRFTGSLTRKPKFRT